MKPFDLEAAKRGEPLITRDGRPAKFVAYVPEADGSHCVVVFIDGTKIPMILTKSGKFYDTDVENGADLFMAPPPMRSINRYEYPEPMRKPLEKGQKYWIAFILEDEITSPAGFVWEGGQ